jgi:hypothetical protein
MHKLYVAARAQLGVSNPEEVASDEPIDSPAGEITLIFTRAYQYLFPSSAA